MAMLPNWAKCSKCNTTEETFLKSMLFAIKCPKCNQKFPSTKYSIIMGISFFSFFMLLILLFNMFTISSTTTSYSNKSSSYNACSGVADQISRYIKNPQPNSNINALRNYYNEAQDLARRFDSDPKTNTNYCASILNAAAKAFLP